MLRILLNFLKRTFPAFFRILFSLRDWVKTIPARLKLFSLMGIEGGGPTVMYLSSRFPMPPAQRNEFAHGGAIKLTYLAENFPHHFPSANLLYAVSSVAHPLQMEILQTAKRKGLQVVVNQNGVAFPAWDGDNYEASNRSLRQLINFADFIIYQSRFCKDSAERYISPPDVPSEVIYNPVDTRLFSPHTGLAKPKVLTLLLGGNQNEKYRLELALQTLKALHHDVPNAKLIVTGNLWLPHDQSKTWTKQAMHEMNLTEHVTFTGTYTQTDAPFLYSKAHLLLHTQYADASPGLVLEAMALGMPVVHLNNGGVPELVGDAGVGVHVEHSWEVINLPESQKMAYAVLQVYEKFDEFAVMARQQAQKFSLPKFIERHKEIFEKILDTKK
jgi:glycosyltransferase involved in cell wall biosynthesis